MASTKNDNTTGIKDIWFNGKKILDLESISNVSKIYTTILDLEQQLAQLLTRVETLENQIQTTSITENEL